MDDAPGLVLRAGTGDATWSCRCLRVVVVNRAAPSRQDDAAQGWRCSPLPLRCSLLKVLEAKRGGTFVSLGDPEFLRVALTDPLASARYGDRPLIIDEVQRV